MEEDFNIMATDSPWEIITALNLDEDMTREQIYDAVFDEYRECYDGQVGDVVIADMCEDMVNDICEELEIS